MAESYIEKKKTVKGAVITTRYRIDEDFKPSKIGDICSEFIENWCVANNQVDWLVSEVNITEYKTKKKQPDGSVVEETVKCDNYPFVNLRADFVNKFFPSILVGNATKGEETFKQKINRLYKK